MDDTLEAQQERIIRNKSNLRGSILVTKVHSSLGAQCSVSANAEAVLRADFTQGLLLEIGVDLHLQTGWFDARCCHDPFDLLAVAVGEADGFAATGIHLSLHCLSQFIDQSDNSCIITRSLYHLPQG